MSTAVVAFVGVALGAILTGGFTYWIERRKQRRLRIGALRLVDLQFKQAETAIRSWAKKGWWGAWTDSAADPWRSGDIQLLIASELGPTDWHIFQSGRTIVEFVGFRRDVRQRETGQRTPALSEEDLRELALALAVIRKVRERLETISAAEATLAERHTLRRLPKPPSQEEVDRALQELSTQPNAPTRDSSPGMQGA